ncbi:CKB_collapsed_G0008630.mRNA.1.CDS.1 [Saccharomyces cerevisiae]|nr:CKB_collapsed_G0008630.mRNA.1.CDS.1 [Saccharomyces cerevisiae]
MYDSLVDVMKKRWIDEGKPEYQFQPPKLSYTKRLVLGSCPRLDVEGLGDLYKNLMSSNFDLQLAKKTAMKAEKLYYRTRTSASPESLKRSKEIISSGWDAQNAFFGKNEEKEKLDFLAKLQNRRNKETVFEFTRNPDDEMAVFMKRRRKQLAPIQRKATERRELLEKERMAGLSHSIEDEILKGDDGETGYTVSEDALKEFEDADQLLEAQENENKKEKRNRSLLRIQLSFLSHYAPAGEIQDKQLQITNGFANDAAQAAYDLNSDDKVQVHKQTATVKWDKKRKKYVNTQGIDNKKYIIGESGQKIAASFRSGRFDDWSKARNLKPLKVGSRETSIPSNLLEDPSQGPAANGRTVRGKFKHKQMKAPKMPDKHRDNYYSQKKKVEKALQSGISVKGYNNAPGLRSELKSTEQIRKDRIIAEKKRAKNARPSKKRKF